LEGSSDVVDPNHMGRDVIVRLGVDYISVLVFEKFHYGFSGDHMSHVKILVIAKMG
jgi:hypothetical protein